MMKREAITIEHLVNTTQEELDDLIELHQLGDPDSEYKGCLRGMSTAMIEVAVSEQQQAAVAGVLEEDDMFSEYVADIIGNGKVGPVEGNKTCIESFITTALQMIGVAPEIGVQISGVIDTGDEEFRQLELQYSESVLTIQFSPWYSPIHADWYDDYTEFSEEYKNEFGLSFSEEEFQEFNEVEHYIVREKRVQTVKKVPLSFSKTIIVK